MYRKVLFNNFHFSIFGTIDIRTRTIEKNKTTAKNRSTVEQKRLRQTNNVDYARPSLAHETAWQTREDLRGREESIFPFLLCLSSALRDHTHLYSPLPRRLLRNQNGTTKYSAIRRQ